MQKLKPEISSPSQTGIGSAVQTVYGRQELTVLCPSAVGVPPNRQRQLHWSVLFRFTLPGGISLP